MSKYTALKGLIKLALTAALALTALHAYAESETDYIVKYKTSAAYLMEEDSVPFDVVSEEEMKSLDAAGLLEYYEPDGEMTFFDDAPYYADDKWDLALINADTALKRQYLGQGVRIGVIDSGINAHTALADNLLTGQSYIDGDASDTADTYGHGTLVAGLIAGMSEDGAIGVASKAQLVPLKVTDGKTVKVSTVCEAMYGAIDDYDCDILNLSLGITSEFQTLKEAVEYADKKGVLIISAVGNAGTSGIIYPAIYDTVIGVGSVDMSGSIYYRSNHNKSVFLTAPGVNVKTTGNTGGYTTATGTSFATPHVTAAAAVLLGIDNTLTSADIMKLLSDTAMDRGDKGYDEYYGYGILNLSKAVCALTCEDDPLEMPCEFISNSVVRNNTDRDLDCTYYLAEYDKYGACTDVRLWQLSIPKNGIAEIEPPSEGSIYGQFIFTRDGLKPLAFAKKPS